MDGPSGMAKSTAKGKAKAKTKGTANKGFGKPQPKKEKSAFAHYWVVEGEVWASDSKGEGSIKPSKTTSQYKAGDTADIDTAIKALAGKPDGFYKYGVHEAGGKPDWKFDELSLTAKRSITSTQALLASQKKDLSGKSRTVFS